MWLTLRTVMAITLGPKPDGARARHQRGAWHKGSVAITIQSALPTNPEKLSGMLKHKIISFSIIQIRGSAYLYRSLCTPATILHPSHKLRFEELIHTKIHSTVTF